ncbi:helix-turn-helix domain-containing protein [Candidatus Eisenbacteria bacterium]|uniref:Helix-turn-helix domain-containing protein n=1 Tax=Eiseniibacteriota bacterium TaxID=2212470 RepID=A0ABV6YMM4_UNCEI
MERLLTVKDLSVLLKVPESWIYARTAPSTENAIPHMRVGKYIRFTESEVWEYLRKVRADG